MENKEEKLGAIKNHANALKDLIKDLTDYDEQTRAELRSIFHDDIVAANQVERESQRETSAQERETDHERERETREDSLSEYILRL